MCRPLRPWLPTRLLVRWLEAVINLPGRLATQTLVRTEFEVPGKVTTIKGIGPWTAQMVLLGALGRPDVWPVGDGGVQRAARNLYGVELDGLEELGERFRPYRSYASWYFWRSLG